MNKQQYDQWQEIVRINKKKVKKMPTIFPSFPQRVLNYLSSRKTWVAAGKPMRSPEVIKYIFNTHCKECEHYKSTGYACDICGCYINENSDWNKIAWYTTRCPDNPPKWIEETNLPVIDVVVDEEMAPESVPLEAIPPDSPELITQPELPPKSPEKPAGGCGCGH
jgi:hypothetical protein